MTADEALDLARFQRPGRRVIVGAVLGRDEPMPPIDDLSVYHLNRLGLSQLDVLEWMAQ